jgi:hypothetical protein
MLEGKAQVDAKAESRLRRLATQHSNIRWYSEASF